MVNLEKKWILFLILSYVIFLLIIKKFNLWHYMGVPEVNPIFNDLRITLHQAALGSTGNLTHSFLWIWIGKLGLKETWLAPLLIILFLIVSIYSLNPINFKESLICTILMISPPILFAIERANMDLIMYLLIWTGAYLLSRNTKIFKYCSVLFLYSASVLKIYPIAAFSAYFLFLKNKTFFFTITGIALALIGSWVWYCFDGLLLLTNAAPHPVGFPIGVLKFGGEFVFILLSIPHSRFLTILFGIIMVVFSYRISKSIVIPDNGISENKFSIFYVVGLSALLFCFLLNLNYDYRCIFFLLLIPYLLSSTKNDDIKIFDKKVNFLLIWAIIFILYNEHFVHAIKVILVIEKLEFSELSRFINRIEPLGNVDRTIYESNWLLINSLIEHTFTWIVMTFLTAIGFKIISSNNTIRKTDIIKAPQLTLRDSSERI